MIDQAGRPVEHQTFDNTPGGHRKAIARITAREDDLPAPRCDEAVDDLRSLVFYRRELVEARTAQINRLHADLTQLRPGYHKQLDSSGLAAPKALNRVSRLISRCPTARAQAR